MQRLAVISYHASPLDEPGAGDSGGMTVYVREVARSLADMGVATDIFTRGDKLRRHRWSDGVNVIAVPAGPPDLRAKDDLFDHVEAFVSGVRSAVTDPYDMIHAHYWQSGVAASSLARSWGVPFVHSSHTLGRVKNRALAPGDRPEGARRIRAERSVIGGADAVVASDPAEAADLRRLYGVAPQRLALIAPGVDHSLFEPGDRTQARSELGLPLDEAVVLYAGRIQPLKGLDLAIEALAELMPALDRPLRLVIAGGASGPAGAAELARLRDRAAVRGVSSAVTFTGPQPQTRLAQLYRAADVAVMTSHSESFGLAALEAQACGTPVVACDVGGLGRIVADGVTGSLVSGRDPSVFAAALKTILSDRNLAHAMGERASKRSMSFSWSRTAESLLELYECLVTGVLPEACNC